MSKNSYSEYDDKLAYFVTGKSLSGKSYMRVPGDGLGDAISEATGLDASFETSKRDFPDRQIHQAQQNAGPEHDIAFMTERLEKQGIGVLPPSEIIGDFSAGIDFHAAVTAIANARTEFLQLPANVRARFQNDPAQFIDFFNDEKNRDEAEKLGLILPKANRPVVQVDVVDTVDRRASLALKKAKADAGVE